MFESPSTLQQRCVDFVCDNLSAVCDTQCAPDDQVSRYVFRDSKCYFHCELSEQLFFALCQKGKLNDQTLALFNADNTNLQHVKIFNSSYLTTEGLRILRSHKITKLEANGLLKITVNDLIGCLGDWSLQNLRLLNVANSSFENSSKFCVVVALSKLKCLESLNVSNTEFNKHGLEIVAEDLLNLKCLDISNTRVTDVSPLLKCRDHLLSLSMYNLKNSNYSEVIPVLLKLNELRYLDISSDKPEPAYQYGMLVKNKISEFLKSPRNLPHLHSVDISGKQDIEVEDLREWLKFHPQLKFLGLAQTDVCYDEMFTEESHEFHVKDLMVTGSGTEDQIMRSLQRYKHRPYYIQKSLFYLFRYTQNYPEPRIDVIKLVLPAMRIHPKHIGIQMAATACLYNLSKGDFGKKIHPCWLSEVVKLTLVAMKNYPNHPQLQKNTLLTLCSDRILQDVSFDRFLCASLVMDCLCTFDDTSMNRMSVAICSILAAKISTEETSLLGSKRAYMKKLLHLVRVRTESSTEVDTTMKFTLSALWNLTDESPTTCNVFLEEGGLELFLKVMQTYQSEAAVETKVLGLLNNIAEVPALRMSLLRNDFIVHIQHLMKSQLIDVSYFAAGIIAHLASSGEDAWSNITVNRKILLTELNEILTRWEAPEGEMVAYRSFHPFIPLMNCTHSWEVQLWAIWAIHHVCSKNPKRYCTMLIEEGGQVILTNLVSDENTHPNVVKSAMNILKMLY